MKVWILSSKFGQGHWSAAGALKERYEHDGHEVIIDDVVAITHPKTNIIIYSFFKKVITRISPLYNFVNHFGRDPKKELKQSKALRKAYEDINPDLILCTWSGAARILGEVDTKVVIYITDFGVHAGWIAKSASLYIVADETMKDKLITYGVSSSMIEVSGIPVKSKFTKRTRAPHGTKNVLIMGGGLGICPWVHEPLHTLTRYNGLKITVITGNNKHLYKKIKRRYPEVNVVGFTENMDKYLKEASVVISKPGGVSLAESIAVGVPFVAIYPSFEHELENAHYIETHHCGAVVRKGESIDRTVLNVMHLKQPVQYGEHKGNTYDMAL